MLQATFHNEKENGKPHVHVWDTETGFDLRSPFYSKTDLRDWIYETETFKIHMCDMIGLPIII